jgi:hypothetical protein
MHAAGQEFQHAWGWYGAAEQVPLTALAAELAKPHPLFLPFDAFRRYVQAETMGKISILSRLRGKPFNKLSEA